MSELWVWSDIDKGANADIRPATPADLIAVVRRGVESGTIKGMRAWHCVSQMDLALYERPHWCRGMGHDDCGWTLVLVDDSSVVHGKRVDVTDGPVSDGGSET